MVTRLEIHPSIGVARVGTSTESFLGPEPGQAPPSSYRDSSPARALLRQAARFRVFAVERDAHGTVETARELTVSDGHISWTVELANRKSAAPRFLSPNGRRNGATGDDATDAALLIRPGPRVLDGPGAQAAFDGGSFRGRAVGLGEARVDADGRLVVVGGVGRAESRAANGGPGRGIVSFADNDDWYDDVADGSVQATFTPIGGGPAVPALAAWLIVGPPDFAPPVTNLVTLEDIAVQAAVERGWLSPPARPSFLRDIQPLLERTVGYASVTLRARRGHGPSAPGNFLARLAVLGDPAGPQAARKRIFDRLKDPTAPAPPGGDPVTRMPRLHDETNSANVLALTPTQYATLRAWVAGTFDGAGVPPRALSLPEEMDRMALRACSGGAFFPGIEAGRILRDPRVYSEPLRLDPTRVVPGQITAGNAVPWQADFLKCAKDGVEASSLAWWPAQRPDDVLTSAAGGTMSDWAENVNSHQEMVDHWHELGVVREVATASGLVLIEQERLLPRGPAATP